MSILSKIRTMNPLSKANRTRRIEEVARTVISAFYTSQGESGILPEMSYYDFVNSYSSWVYTSVNKIAQTIAGAPKIFFTYKSKGSKEFLSGTHVKQLSASLGEIKCIADKERYLKARDVERVEITDNPIVLLFQQPNPVDTHFNFWYEAIMKLELAGAIGVYKKKNGLGVPTELWILPTSENGEFKVVPDGKSAIRGYHYSDDELELDFKPEEIIWPHYPNPKTKFEGYSPLRAQLYPYNIDKFLQQQQYYLFKNKSFVGGMLTTEQKLTKAEVANLKEQISDGYKGVKKTGEMLVAHSGLKYDGTMNSNIGDIFIDDTSKMMKDRIFSAHGINEGIVGLTENQNKANLDTSREIYLQECIRPRWKMLSEYLHKDLLSDFDERIMIDIVLPEFTQRDLDILERRVNLETRTTVVNEERAKMNLESVPWGDEPYNKQPAVNPFGQQEPAPSKEQKGGEGSGNHGHEGRPGERGGSGPGGGFQEASSGEKSALSDGVKGVMNKKESDSLKMYQEEGGDLNLIIRGGGKQSDLVKDMISDLDNVFDKAPALKEDIEVYRFLKDSSFIPEEGGIFSDAAYVSTSFSKEGLVEAKANFLVQNNEHITDVRILVPKGTKVLPITTALNRRTFDNEDEALLPRNRSFKVISKSEKQITLKYIDDVKFGDFYFKKEKYSEAAAKIAKASYKYVWDKITGPIAVVNKKSFEKVKALTAEQKAILWKKFDLAAEDCEPPYREAMIKIFKAQAAEVVSNLEAKGVIVKGHIAGWGRQKVRTWLGEHKDKTSAINIDRAAWEKETAAELKPAVVATLKKAAAQRAAELSKIKAKFEYDVDDEATAKWIGTKLREVSKQVTGTTFDDIEAVLQAGFEEGKPLGTIASELRASFDTAEKYRADLIARTEAANTFNAGDLDSVRQMGLEEDLKKFWLNEPDARETHVQAGEDYSEDGAIGIDDEFKVGDDSMLYPGGGNQAGENINCRCTIGYVKAGE